MIEIFLFALRAVLPILLMILLGYLVRRIGPWDGAFFNQLNKLAFHLFLPVQLFLNVYEMEELSQVNWRLIAYVVAGIFFCLAVGVLAARLFVPEPTQKGVIVMTAFRSNQVILGLPLAEALGGGAALGFAAVATSVCVPVFNILAVLTLVFYNGRQEKGRFSLRTVLLQTLKNPLIIGAMLGFAVVFLRSLLPTVDGVPVFTIRRQLPSVYKVLTDLSKVASPLMLFVLGTKLDFKAVRGLLPQITLGALLRLVLMPAAVIGAAVCLRDALGLTALEMPTLLAIFAAPTAVGSTVMVQEIGGDEQLASQLVVWTSTLSMLTIFCFVCVLQAGGLL
ncbi:MAG: AEC family transporter [Oscillospiraceae bacterium]